MREAGSTQRKTTHRPTNTGGALMQTTKSWTDARSFVEKEIEQNPLRTVLIALGAGYVLGGGLFSNLTGRLVGTSARMALRAVSLPVILRGGMELGGQLFSAERDAPAAE